MSLYRIGSNLIRQSGGSGLWQTPSGALPDLSWSFNVTGSAKSAALGFAVPVAFNAAEGEQGGQIYPITSTGLKDFYAERPLGATGTLTVTFTLFASLNTVSGTHFTPSSQSITWADGEVGWKKITFNILALPTGPGLVGISATGTGNWGSRVCWYWLRGSGRAPGAIYVQSSNGVNVAGNTSGSGTQGSPYQSVAFAMSQMGNTGGFLYFINNGTHVEWSGTARPDGTLTHGVQPTNLCSQTSPLVLLPDPSNSSTILWDNGSTAGGAAILYSNSSAFTPTVATSGIWLCGIHFHRCAIDMELAGSNGFASTDWVTWQLEIDNYAVDNSNIAGIRADGSVRIIIQDCNIHEIYSTESGAISNPYTSVASGFKEGIISFNAQDPSVSHSRFDLLQCAVLNKQSTPTGATTWTQWDISHCLGFRFTLTNSATSGEMIQYPLQGGDFHNGLLRYTVHDGSTESPGSDQMFVCAGSGTGQGDHHDMYNCVSIGGTGVFKQTGMKNTRVWNCIIQSGTLDQVVIGNAPTTTVHEYMDGNLYVNPHLSWGAGGTFVSTLAAWKALSNSALANPMDPSSTQTSTPPSYANQAAFNYRLTSVTGVWGRPYGVGNEGVGIRNNFLNTDLPVTA